jgi:hypothetical protein
MSFVIVALVLAAAYLAAGPDAAERLKAAASAAFGRLPHLERRHVAAAALVTAAAIAWASSQPGPAPAPSPTPAPGPAAGLDLRGLFVGPDAAADAAKVSALMEETAAELEWDGMQREPFLKTGVGFDELRVRMFDLRCRGESLGSKHPLARDAIRGYLDEHAGKSGGPMSPAQRAAWIAACREVAREAGRVAR